MPSTFNPKRRVLYILAETTEGTWAGNSTVFVVDDAVVPPESIKLSPDVEFTDREVESPTGENIASIAARRKMSLSFSSRLIAPPSKGAAGPLSPLFKTFLLETLVASTSASYSYDINSATRLSIGHGMLRENGALELQHGIAGAGVSKCTIKGDGPGKAVMVDWELTGKVPYASAAPVVIDDTTPQTAIIYVDDVKHGFTLNVPTTRTGIFARNISKFELDFDLKGELGVDIGDASTYDWLKSGFITPTLKLDPAMEPSGSFPDLANLCAGLVGASSLGLTNPNGDVWTLTIPNLQPKKLGDSSRDNTATWDFEGSCYRSQDGATATAADAVSMVFA